MCFTCIHKSRCTEDADLFNCTDDDYFRSCPQWNIVDNEHMDSVPTDDIDLSNETFINDLWLVAPASEIIIKTSACLPIVIWGISGNILLLYIIIKNRHLHTPTTLLIGNMAAADLITLLIQPWVFLIYDFFQNYQLGAVLLASVLNLVAISYDRLNAIVLPQEKRLSKSGAKIIMVVAWISSFVLAIPLSIFRYYKERQWLDFLEKFCTEDAIITNIYWHVIITMIVWFPLGVMLICYIGLFFKLKQYEKKMFRKLKSVNVSYKKKVAQMMFIIVITFMICRLPFTALIFYRNQLLDHKRITTAQQVQNQADGAYHILWFISRYLIILNAAINPVIYGLTCEKYRKAFKATAIGKWLFVFDGAPLIKTDTKVKKELKQKPNNTATKTTNTANKMKIFSIFRGKFNRNVPIGDTTVTESGSNVRILK